MGNGTCKISRQYSPLHFHGMCKRQCVGDFFKYAANQLQIKPGTGQPRSQIGQQRAADAAHLFVTEDTAAKQSQTDI